MYLKYPCSNLENLFQRFKIVLSYSTTLTVGTCTSPRHIFFSAKLPRLHVCPQKLKISILQEPWPKINYHFISGEKYLSQKQALLSS